MDRSLLQLTWLRLGASLRRWRRSLARPKGILVTVAVALMFLPSLGSLAVFLIHPPPSQFGQQVERFGPMALLTFTLFTLATSSGGTGLYFQPAEIDFLFPGPYSRRQLIAYKLAITALGIALTALFVGAMGAVTAPWPLAAIVAAFLTFLFLHLIQSVVGLVVNLLGALIWRRNLRWGALAVAAVVTLIVLPSRDRLVAQDWVALGKAAEASPLTHAVLTPFRWFTRAYSAPNLPALLTYGGLALGIDAALIGAIFLLDAGFLEAAANSSAKKLALAQRMARGGGTIHLARGKGGRFQVRVPSFPWLGGAGPNLWRQLAGALGNPTQVLTLAAGAAGLAYFFTMILTRKPDAANPAILAGFASGTGMPLIIFLSLFLAYDFRGDLDVMESLKMLPIRPGWLALGQILAPTLLACFVQICGGLGLIAALGGIRGHEVTFAVVLAFLIPANFLFYAIENLLFLWFPTRMVAGQFNGVAAVRQVLVLLAKLLALGLAVGLTVSVAALTMLLSGRSEGAALLTSWLTLVGLGLALLPLLAHAFDRFDVGADTPA